MNKKLLLIGSLILLAVSVAGCSASDRWHEDMYLSTLNVGSDAGEIDLSDGGILLTGDARYQNCVWVEASGIRAPGAKPATQATHGLLELPVWRFADQALAANQETISFSVKIPDCADRSEVPLLSLGWTGGSEIGNVYWQIEYLWTAEDENTSLGAEGTDTILDATSAVKNGLVITTFTGITHPSDTDVCLHARLKRLSADASDTMASYADLHGICMTWVSNRLGGDVP